MNVLAISAHPDDVEIACSGTLAKCVKRGDRVVVCHLSTGNLGHVIIPPDELTKIRAAEAERAGKMAGIEVIGGMFDDIDIYDNNKAARDKVIDVIRYANPDFIITHNPDDYMPDHTAVSRLVFDASFGATIPNYKTKQSGVAKLVPIYYMDPLAGVNFQPTEYVDITDEEAVNAFEYLSRTEGIIPAIESSHAVAAAIKIAPTMDKDQIMVINLSGRGDKDVYSIAKYRGVKIREE